MTDDRDTPIIDAAVAASHGTHPAYVRDILRAALPWDLPAERLEAMARKACPAPNAPTLWEQYKERVIATYHAMPIMRELYPEHMAAAAQGDGLSQHLKDWQPIESAPKDGTIVLIWVEARSWMLPAYWGRDNEMNPPGWIGGHCRVMHIDQPTHWMPMPCPPPL